MKKYLLIIIFIFIFSPFLVFGQINDDATGFDFSTVPLYPKPNESFEIKINYYGSDTSNVLFEWYVNGELVDRGLNKKEIEAMAGDAGKPTSVRLVVRRGQLTPQEINYTIYPNSVDIIVDPQTTIPVFYKGSSVQSFQSNPFLIAIPNFYNRSGARVPTDQLIFEWKIDGSKDDRQSGLGKNIYIYQNNMLSRAFRVELVVSDISNDLKTREIKSIDFEPIEIVFYEEKDLINLTYVESIGNTKDMYTEEMIIKAFPYNIMRNPDDVEMTWKVNNKKIDNETGNVIYFKRVDSNPGSTNVKFELLDYSDMLQIGSGQFTLKYDDENYVNNNFGF